MFLKTFLFEILLILLLNLNILDQILSLQNMELLQTHQIKMLRIKFSIT